MNIVRQLSTTSLRISSAHDGSARNYAFDTQQRFLVGVGFAVVAALAACTTTTTVVPSGATFGTGPAIPTDHVGGACSGVGTSPGDTASFKNSDCPAGICIADARTGFDSYCSADCEAGSCPSGYTCEAVRFGDVKHACLRAPGASKNGSNSSSSPSRSGSACKDVCAKAAVAKCSSQSSCESECEQESAKVPKSCTSELDALLTCEKTKGSFASCNSDGTPKVTGCDDEGLAFVKCVGAASKQGADAGPTDPNTQSCGPFQLNTTSCDQCFRAKCCALGSTCGENQDCVALVGCASKCNGDAACVQRCSDDHPQGQADVQSMDQCLNDNCSTQCQ